MADRAVITTEKKEIGIYLHWNGDINSIEAFLKYCKDMGFHTPEKSNYGWARLCQVIANYFGNNGLSIGIDSYNNLYCNNGNNGVYIIKDFEIVGREFNEIDHQDSYEVKKMLLAIDKAQPFRIYE